MKVFLLVLLAGVWRGESTGRARFTNRTGPAGAWTPQLLGVTETADDIPNVPVTAQPRTLVMEANSTYRLTVEDSLDNSTAFLVFEAHSLQFPLLLAPSLVSEERVNSTSPALYATPAQIQQSGGVMLANPHSTNNSVIVFVRQYGAENPVPGACSSRPGPPIKPYLELSWTRPLVELRFSLAGTVSSCTALDQFTYQVYQYFLPENDCSALYFQSGYRRFIEIEDIRENGELVSALTHHRTNLTLSNYPRTGRIIAVIVNYKNGSSVYGLAHSYGCELDAASSNGCRVHDSTFIWISCALGVFVGLFLTFVGHRFFKCSQFLFGFYLGSLVGFILFSLLTEFGENIIVVLASTMGVLSALVVLAVWWFLGIPVLSVVLPTLEVGFILASMLMYFPLCGVESLAVDSTYWLVFTCMVLAPGILFIAFTQKASIISCAVLGTITVVLSIDHYVGSNLKFMFINVIHRVIVPDFGEAHQCPPFQKTDLLLITCFLGGIALGLVIQLILERKKAPFPPSPFQQWRWVRNYHLVDENTPLLTGQVSAPPEDTYRTPPPVVGFIAGYSPAWGSSPSTSRNHTRERQIQVSGGSCGSFPQHRDIFSPPAPSQSLPLPYPNQRDIFSPPAPSNT